MCIDGGEIKFCSRAKLFSTFFLAKESWCVMYENGSLMMLRTLNAPSKRFTKSMRGFIDVKDLK